MQFFKKNRLVQTAFGGLTGNTKVLHRYHNEADDVLIAFSVIFLANVTRTSLLYHNLEYELSGIFGIHREE